MRLLNVSIVREQVFVKRLSIYLERMKQITFRIMNAKNVEEVL